MKIKVLALCLLSQAGYGATNLEKLIEKTEPKVVKIGIVTDKGEGVCSGAFIRADGLVLTCAHCFAHGKVQKIFVKTADGDALVSRLVALDIGRDLALVETPWSTRPYVKLGNTPTRGDQVISFGSPLDIQHCATVGYVSNLLKRQIAYILHTAFINPGNSGGHW